ncbi:MAG: nucleotidyl transferase AbiEii/AbiGii toxin family protein [Pseudomonadota bacterium]
MKFFEEVVDRATIEAAKSLGAALGERFYLAGGTAIALQLRHRISLDLDLFSGTNELRDRDRDSILRALRPAGGLEVVENSEGTLNLRIDGAAVSLFHYPYPLVHVVAGKWQGLPVADLRDIGAMKLSAVVGRGSKKDFIDLFFLAKKLGLRASLETAEGRFRDHPGFTIAALKALVYFEDAEKESMPRMRKPADWEEMKRFFRREVRALFRP